MDKIGKYLIEEKIGVGGFGLVYRGRDPFIKRVVAIKTCQSQDEEIKKRFFREAEFAGNLQHRHIVTIYDFGVQDGTPYIVQEFLSGEDLDKKIKRRDDIPLITKIGMLVNICDALEHAHQAGIIHRDIKPANIRVIDDGTAKMMDFGIAKSLSAESNLTQTGITLGTAAYLAPEQIKGEPLDRRTDIFSLGILMYELFAYERPFKGEHISTVLYRILNEPLPDLNTLVGGLPPRLVSLVDRATAKLPDDRPPTAGAIRDELASILIELGGSLDNATRSIPYTAQLPIGTPTPSSGIEMLIDEDEKTRTTPSGIPVQKTPVPAGSPVAVTAPLATVPPTEATPRVEPTLERVSSTARSRTAAPPPPTPKKGANPLVALLVLGAVGGAGWFGWQQIRSAPTTAPPPASENPTPVAPPRVEPPTEAPVEAPATNLPPTTAPPEPAPRAEKPKPAAPKPVAITLTANQPATISLDGQVVGESKTKVELKALPGKHDVRYAIEGVDDQVVKIDVVAGADNTFHHAFPAWGKLTVTQRPGTPGGELTIDGKAYGKTPVRDVRLAAGSHEVVVTKEGYQPWRQVVEIEGRKAAQLTVALEPLPGEGP